MTITHIGRKLVWSFNLVWLVVVVLIFLTPYLAHLGSPVAKFLYLLFKPTCHQRPDRSFFLWGHKMAVCARCTGIYTSLLFWGTIFGILLALKKVKPLPLWGLALLLLPTAIDGGTQLIDLRESTNLLRLITGHLTGLAIVWYVYPRAYQLEDSEFSTSRQSGTYRATPAINGKRPSSGSGRDEM